VLLQDTLRIGRKFINAFPSTLYAELPRPIETLLSLPRVRLIDKVPILETEEYLRRFMNQSDHKPMLVDRALQVSEGSAQQFSTDDKGLSALLEEIDSAEYVVTRRSKVVMEKMLHGICADGRIFKGFEKEIEPLYDASPNLRGVAKLADNLADKTKEESLDLARALLIGIPAQSGRLSLRPHEISERET
jgi:hypothetical protein